MADTTEMDCEQFLRVSWNTNRAPCKDKGLGVGVGVGVGVSVGVSVGVGVGGAGVWRGATVESVALSKLKMFCAPQRYNELLLPMV
jgi:hypothetical protein